MNVNIGNELALMLKKSPDKEVAALADAYLQLEAEYGALKHKLILASAELIMYTHSDLFEKLAESDTGDPIE